MSNALASVPVSTQKHRWYRSKIVPAAARALGFESLDEAHRHFIAGFYCRSMEERDLPSMADMSDEEAGRFLDYAIRISAECGLVIDDADPTKRRYPKQ